MWCYCGNHKMKKELNYYDIKIEMLITADIFV